MRDPYQVLGVAKGASAGEIKSAFRQAAKKFHPDQNPNDAKAAERFAEVNTAYEILGDEKKRAEFDNGLIGPDGKPRAQNPFAGNRRGGNPFEGFADAFNANGPGAFDFKFDRRRGSQADDILSSLFGAGFGPSQERRKSAKDYSPPKGNDVTITHQATIDDLFAGKTLIALPTGETLAVRFPEGFQDGQTLRLKGKGYPGPSGSAAGNANVTLRLKPESGRRFENGAIVVDCAVPLSICINGGKAPVVTPDGTLQITVPAMSDASTVLRVRERGAQLGKGTRGDILVAIRPIFTEPEKAAIRAFGETLQSVGASLHK